MAFNSRDKYRFAPRQGTTAADSPAAEAATPAEPSRVSPTDQAFERIPSGSFHSMTAAQFRARVMDSVCVAPQEQDYSPAPAEQTA